jgi:hypothetical protein
MKYNALKKGISLLILTAVMAACEKDNVSTTEFSETKTAEKSSNNSCITLDETSLWNSEEESTYLRLTVTNISGVNAVYPIARDFKFLNLPSGLDISTSGGSLSTFHLAGKTNVVLIPITINGDIPPGFVLQFSFETLRYTNCDNTTTVTGSVALN